MNGPPPCHARFEDLYQIGLEAGAIAGRRKGRFSQAIFQGGILEAIIELGRARLALENGCYQTLLGDKKEDRRIVQEIMRHASGKMLDVYQHGNIEAKRSALNHASGIFVVAAKAS